MTRISLKIALFALSGSTAVYAADPTPRREVVNGLTDTGLSNVGALKRDGRLSCTATVIKHGVLLTAKHCFTHENQRRVSRGRMPVAPRELSISFPVLKGTREKSFDIASDRMLEIRLDEGVNDIAYVLYEPRATETAIQLPEFRIVKDAAALKAGTPLEVVGFPVGDGFNPYGDVDMRVSKSCGFMEKTGYILPKPQDSGYDGLLHDTDCMAWFGNSGGPVLSPATGGKRELYGVLTHTFDTLASGEVDPSVIRSDSHGEYSVRSNISPLYLAKSLDQVLAKGARAPAVP